MSARHLFACLGCALVSLGAPVLAEAQIVNVLDNIKDGDGVSGELGLAFGFKTGNTTLVELKGDLGLGLRLGDHLVYVIGRAQFGTKQPIGKLSADSFDSGLVHISRAFGHVRYRYTLLDWFGLEAFVQPEADRFRDLGFRFVVGGGPRVWWELYPDLRLAVGCAYMMEHERYNESLLSAATSHRWSTYIQTSFRFDETFALSTTTFFQPRLFGDEPVFDVPTLYPGSERPVVVEMSSDDRRVISDLRISSESALSVTVKSWFKIKFSLTFGYNSNPPPQAGDIQYTCRDAAFGPADCPADSTIHAEGLAQAFAKQVKPLDVGFDTTLVLSF